MKNLEEDLFSVSFCATVTIQMKSFYLLASHQKFFGICTVFQCLSLEIFSICCYWNEIFVESKFEITDKSIWYR